MSTACMSSPEAAFREAMANAGLVTQNRVVADGQLHRIHLEGDNPRSENGWYVLHADAPISGAFGCWKRGISGSWTLARESDLSWEDRRELSIRATHTRAERLRQDRNRQSNAAQRAAYIWNRSVPADPNHPYLIRKQVSPGTARQKDGRLVLPVLGLDGKLYSLQFIDSDGGKLLLSGGRKRGNVIPVAGRIPGASLILICEGWATGRTLAEMEPRALVLAAVDAGNLEPVARSVRERWPTMEIVICCDADQVGIQKGRAAAIASNARVAIPEFPAGVSGSDFNDLAVSSRGVAAQ